uniref:Endonuclease/exonuclease/phosphatase domain-containing protein n=1 Tax=Phlebotomus papatasi TaxID=29031 RepID=A0A1B0DHR0_PHLPP
MRNKSYNYLSSGEPTYWPSDRNKQPDLLDFAVSSGIDVNRCSVESCLDLSSDHTPVFLHLEADVDHKPKGCSSATVSLAIGVFGIIDKIVGDTQITFTRKMCLGYEGYIHVITMKKTLQFQCTPRISLLHLLFMNDAALVVCWMSAQTIDTLDIVIPGLPGAFRGTVTGRGTLDAPGGSVTESLGMIIPLTPGTLHYFLLSIWGLYLNNVAKKAIDIVHIFVFGSGLQIDEEH